MRQPPIQSHLTSARHAVVTLTRHSKITCVSLSSPRRFR